MIRPPPRSTLFPYPPLFRSGPPLGDRRLVAQVALEDQPERALARRARAVDEVEVGLHRRLDALPVVGGRAERLAHARHQRLGVQDRKSTRLNSSHANISYAV